MTGNDTAYLKALLFTRTTKERVELIQGQMLAILCFVSALLVNGGWLTKVRNRV